MGRRIARRQRPHFDEMERREMLSAITDMMAANSLTEARSRLGQAAGTVQTQASSLGGFVPSTTSIAIAQNQGPPPIGTNLALTPTGTLTRRQLRKELFVAKFTGSYTIGAGRTSTEAMQTFITGEGQPTQCCIAISRC